MIHNTKYRLTIGWLYPDLMSIYGDRGNIIALTRRCEWRGIKVEIKTIDQTTSDRQLSTCDLLFMGGAQDRQQTIVAKDLQKKKKALSNMIEDGIPGLYICGGFQFLGRYYKEADGTVIEQLGVLDVYTENPGGKRLIGDISVQLFPVILNEVKNPKLGPHVAVAPQDNYDASIIIGFENHGGRTRLGEGVKPLGKVIKGYGSNAQDHTEGAVYKNSIGTYLHGPILPKNPILTDWLIAKALEKKYHKPVILSANEESHSINRHPELLSASRQDVSGSQTIILPPLNETIANLAHNAILKRM